MTAPIDAETEARFAEERERRARRRERRVDPLGVLDEPSERREALSSGVEPAVAWGVLTATASWIRRTWRRRSSVDP